MDVTQIRHVVAGVEYLHNHRPIVVHGDLKGDNILIDFKDGEPFARLADFGLSYAIEELSEMHDASSSSSTYLGNPRWLAFERLMPSDYGFISGPAAHSKQSDVFELMRTVLEVLSHNPPFHGLSSWDVHRLVWQKKNPDRPSKAIEFIDDELWQLMVRTWNSSPLDRPSLSEVGSVIQTHISPLIHQNTRGGCTLSEAPTSEATV